MVWEAVFMLVVLKIPVVYLGLVVWWAIRDEPANGEPPEGVRVTDTPPLHPAWSARPRGRRPRRPGPPRRPSAAPRVSTARVARGAGRR